MRDGLVCTKPAGFFGFYPRRACMRSRLLSATLRYIMSCTCKKTLQRHKTRTQPYWPGWGSLHILHTCTVMIWVISREHVPVADSTKFQNKRFSSGIWRNTCIFRFFMNFEKPATGTFSRLMAHNYYAGLTGTCSTCCCKRRKESTTTENVIVTLSFRPTKASPAQVFAKAVIWKKRFRLISESCAS